MQQNQDAHVVVNALNQILNRITVFAEGIVMARKLVAKLEAENAELQAERDELARANSEHLTRQAMADAGEKPIEEGE